MSNDITLIEISGPMASGKSSLARALCCQLLIAGAKPSLFDDGCRQILSVTPYKKGRYAHIPIGKKLKVDYLGDSAEIKALKAVTRQTLVDDFGIDAPGSHYPYAGLLSGKRVVVRVREAS